MIIALLLKCSLNIVDYLVRWQTIIGVDRAIIGVIRIGGIAPSWVPPAGIPVIPSTVNENYAVVMASPPTPVMPHSPVVPEGPIIFTSPVLAFLNSSVWLKRYGRDRCRTRLGLEIELMGLVCLKRSSRGRAPLRLF